MLFSHPGLWIPGWVPAAEASQACGGFLSVWCAADLWTACPPTPRSACHPETAADGNMTSLNIRYPPFKHFSLLEKHIMKQIYLKMDNHHGHQRDYWSHSPGWRCRQRPAPQCSEAQPGPACWTRCSWCRRGSRGLRRLSACWGEECCRPRRPTDLWFDRDTKSNINSLP